MTARTHVDGGDHTRRTACGAPIIYGVSLSHRRAEIDCPGCIRQLEAHDHARFHPSLITLLARLVGARGAFGNTLVLGAAS